MTKTTTPEVPAAPAAPKKPFAISIAAPCHLAFAEAVVHARNGFTFSDGPIEIAGNGMAFFTMIQGSPNEHAIQSAKESSELSIEQEEAKYRKDVENAAKRIIEQQRRDELEKQVAEAVASHEKQIAALKRQARNEIQQLERATAEEIAKLKQ